MPESTPSEPAAVPPVIAEVVRNGFVECVHRGTVVGLNADGSVAFAVGDVEAPMLPRSSNKPVQGLGMVRLGLDLPADLMALSCASHSGEPFHLEAARRILASAGLDESALQTPPDYPIDEQARLDWIRAGRDKASVAMNCSGKHSAMLATCVVNGWPTETYRDPGHPLQQAIAATFSELTGEPVEVTAVDGCGAPLLSASTLGLARAFRSIAIAEDGPERRVADAIRQHPAHVSGTTRDELTLLTALPGAIGKAGAEACYAVALPDGRAVAIKVADGNGRATPPVMSEALRRLGCADLPGADLAGVERAGTVRVLGHGEPVGEVRPVF